MNRFIFSKKKAKVKRGEESTAIHSGEMSSILNSQPYKSVSHIYEFPIYNQSKFSHSGNYSAIVKSTIRDFEGDSIRTNPSALKKRTFERLHRSLELRPSNYRTLKLRDHISKTLNRRIKYGDYLENLKSASIEVRKNYQIEGRCILKGSTRDKGRILTNNSSSQIPLPLIISRTKQNREKKGNWLTQQEGIIHAKLVQLTSNPSPSLRVLQNNWPTILNIINQPATFLTKSINFAMLLKVMRVVVERYVDLVKVADFSVDIDDIYLQYDSNLQTNEKINLEDPMISYRNAMTLHKPQSLKIDPSLINPEHLYLMRRILCLYFIAIEKHFSHVIIDSVALIKEFQVSFKKLSLIHPGLFVHAIDAYSKLVNKIIESKFKINYECFMLIVEDFITILNNLFTQNLYFWSNEALWGFNLDFKQNQLGIIFAKMFSNSMINSLIFEDESSSSIQQNLTSLLQILINLMDNMKELEKTNGTHELIMNIYSILFSVLRNSSLFFFFCEIGGELKIKPGDFFRNKYLTLLKRIVSPHVTDMSNSTSSNILFCLECVLSHIEKSWELESDDQIIFEEFLIKETLLSIQFLLRAHKLPPSENKPSLLNSRITTIMRLLFEIVGHSLLSTICEKGGYFAIQEIEPMRLHIESFINELAKLQPHQMRETERIMIRQRAIYILSLLKSN